MLVPPFSSEGATKLDIVLFDPLEAPQNFLDAIAYELSELLPANLYAVNSLAVGAIEKNPSLLLRLSHLQNTTELKDQLSDYIPIMLPHSVMPIQLEKKEGLITRVQLAGGNIEFKRSLNGTATRITWVEEIQTPKCTDHSRQWSDKEIPAERLPIPYDANFFDERNVFVARVLDQLPSAKDLGKAKSTWTAGVVGWKKLARRGILVNGCTDSIGETQLDVATIRNLFPGEWVKLTHQDTIAEGTFFTNVIPYYKIQRPQIPSSITDKTHFFWHSGTMLRAAIAQYPEIKGKYHASGLGESYTVMSEVIPKGHYQPFLNENSWRFA